MFDRLLSHPSRVRGLKRAVARWMDCLSPVAPFTGAWIETIGKKDERTIWEVAPFTGAWIETKGGGSSGQTYLSHPSRVRGLKRASFLLLSGRLRRTLHGCVD